MGLFDFFKKKDNQEPADSNAPQSALFLSMKKYNEYIVRFIGMQQQGNYAPISAYEKPDGEIVGFLYFYGEDTSYSLSAKEVVSRMETNFEKRLINGEISSYTIFYHSQNDGNHKVMGDGEQPSAITIAYHFKDGENGKIALTYSFQDNKISYQGFKNFSKEENNIIFKTQLQQGKDYFQDQEEIKSPVVTNENGITIKKSNTKGLSNTWSGIFGYESYKDRIWSQRMMEYWALSMTTQPVITKDKLKIFHLEYPDVIFRAVVDDSKPKTFLPVIKTSYTVDVETRDIDEWENSDGLEAIVSGKGRDTFGLWYYATDYAANKDRYLTEKKLNINISGIAFVLDVFSDKKERTVKFSEDFTSYMPNNDLPDYACFDFIGELEDFREITLLDDGSVKGYIMKVRLITNQEVKDFFTIEMYVTPENMRFKDLVKGMKLTGMFQMQGQIAG